MPTFFLRSTDPDRSEPAFVAAANQDDALARFNDRLGFALTFNPLGTPADWILARRTDPGRSSTVEESWSVFHPVEKTES